MTVQSTQLLHLAEETSDLAQDGGLSKDVADNIWDARYNKIKNLLDPTAPGDAVTLRYITKNQNSLLNQLKNTGDKQNTRLNATGDAQNKRITDTGNYYVETLSNISHALKAGDKVSIGNIVAGGYITAGGTSFRFIIPLNKVSAGKLNGTLNGTFAMRQNGKYVFGDTNASDTFDLSTYFTFDKCVFNPCGFILAIMHPKKSALNVANNDVFSVEFYDLVFQA